MPHAVPPRHSFLEAIYDETPGRELEAKLGFLSLVEPIETVAQIAGRMAVLPDILVMEEPFHPVVNTVHKYLSDEGKSFSVIQRADGVRFVKRKPHKTKRPDGVIVSEETKTAWDAPDAFPTEIGISTEGSELIGVIKRQKDGMFVQKGDRIYQIVLDTVKVAPESNRGNAAQDVLQQLEIEYKGSRTEAALETGDAQTAAAIDSVAQDIVHIRNLAQACLADIGLATKLTKMSKTKWLRKLPLATEAVVLTPTDTDGLREVDLQQA